MSIAIYLVTTASETTSHSIEAGRHDGRRHFDHHGQFVGNPAPCNNMEIPHVIGDVEITHLDADTFIGILRMMGEELPDLDYSLMEQIDLGGSSVCPDKYNPTLLYMVGLGAWARAQKFPRPSQEGPVDVTDLINSLVAVPPAELIELGRAATMESERTYRECQVKVDNPVGLWAIGPDDPLDPSRPYEDGCEVVVVYRDHYKSISVYCSPTSDFTFGGKTLAGILFSGHAKACGSPRGQEMTREDALSVYRAVLEEVANA